MHAGFSVLLLLFLLGVGVPVAWSFAGTLLMLTLVYDVNLNTLMLQGFRSLNSLVLLALPLFIMAGYLMQAGGIAHRLVGFAEMLVKNRRGGMGASMVLASGVFGAISGTASAAVASIGTILVDPMEQRGYPRQYSAALLGISSLLGILIPPSITMILFAVVTQQSVVACFAATIGPGILLMVGLTLFNYVVAGRWFKELPAQAVDEKSRRSSLKTLLYAVPALCIPTLILGGIYGGVFTPTEAAAVAVVLVIGIGCFVYRELTLGKLRDSFVRTAETTGTVILILLFSFLIGRILVAQGVPQDLTAFVTGLVDSPIGILLMVNVFLILVGMIIDDVSLTVVVAPLLLPLVGVADVNPIQFAAIVACAVIVGSNSPPMAPVLYMSCRISKVTVHRSFGPAIAMIVFVAIPIQLITTFVPAVSLAFPRMLGLL
ncbi:TRAP transporter large permease [Alcaligenes sp. DN25]|uniref:TRAP transporter large permease n=1 Tax=Alcaligenes TaxID=507 RepID=UPI00202DE05B|nr:MULTISPECIES: TRAP transporter large permease [Alcaligenes]URW83869.1 TRAP transporter large permease [Alcaligenes sp. DN25]UTM02172.1 TRAP transporter large permease [Alcaligenes sp. NLF5-7]WEA68707.1 TRAP transporter large permease [Alcaligenes faecalis]